MPERNDIVCKGAFCYAMEQRGGKLMKENHKIFADEYLIDFNATRAYLAAYPNTKSNATARTNGGRLLANADIAKYIEERKRDREERTEIKQDGVLQELAVVAFANIFDYMQMVDGEWVGVSPDNIPKELMGAVADIKETKSGFVYKLHDKMKALELIGRHLGMWNDKVEVKGMDSEKSKLDSLISQMKEKG